MSDPYKMVLINIIASALLVSLFLTYRFLFPKRRIDPIIILILISLLSVINIFRAGVYESGDFNIHIYRSVAFYDSLREGNIMPSWASGLNATYGYPLFLFNYVFPYYVIAFFHFLGMSFIFSLKIFLALAMVLSGIFMYLFIKKILSSKTAALISSLSYVFAPYHLIDLHFKVAIGEILIFTLTPLCFLLIHNLYYDNSLFLLALASIVTALLIFSHASLSIFVIALLILYVLFLAQREKVKRIPVYPIASVVFGFLISLYNWASPILLSSYTLNSLAKAKTVYFPSLIQLLYSPWRFGLLFQGSRGEDTYLIGYPQLIIVLAILILIIMSKISQKQTSFVIFWLASLTGLIFLISPYSKFLWEQIPLFASLGSHRLLILVNFSTSVIAGYLVLNISKNIYVYAIGAIIVWSTILNWGHRRLISGINDQILRSNLPRSTAEVEGHYYAKPKWVDPNNMWFRNSPKNHIYVVSGKLVIKEFNRTTTSHAYWVEAKKSSMIIDNTLFFPGWNAYIDNKIPIETYPSKNGLIEMRLPQGNYELDINYRDILPVRIVKYISLSLLSLFVAMLIFPAIKKSVLIKSSKAVRKHG